MSKTPYMIYYTENIARVTEQNPAIVDQGRVLADEWRSMSPQEKQVYENRAKKLKEENYRTYMLMIVAFLSGIGLGLAWRS